MKAENDPKTKLTLSVKKSVVERAKEYAVREGSSLSSIVEDFLAEYTKTEKPNDAEFKKSLPYLLMGCARSPLSNMTDEEIKSLWAKEKYGI